MLEGGDGKEDGEEDGEGQNRGTAVFSLIPLRCLSPSWGVAGTYYPLDATSLLDFSSSLEVEDKSESSFLDKLPPLSDNL